MDTTMTKTQTVPLRDWKPGQLVFRVERGEEQELVVREGHVYSVTPREVVVWFYLRGGMESATIRLDVEADQTRGWATTEEAAQLAAQAAQGGE